MDLLTKLTVDKANFPIREEPLITNSNLETGFKAVINENTNSVIGVATHKYHTIPNADVQKFFDEQIISYFPKKVAESISVQVFLPHNGGKYIKKYQINGEEYKVEIKENDFVSPTISTYNSYDSSLAMGFDIGAYRLVCSNGMMIGQNFGSKKMRHYVTCSPEVFQKDLADAMIKYLEITSKWKQWVNIPMTMSDATKYLEKEIVSEKKSNEIIAQFEREQEKTMWGFFNSITWVISHQTTARNPENTILSQMNLGRLVNNLYKVA